MTRTIHETLVARVGVVGMAEEGMGTAAVTIDLDSSNEDIGVALAHAFRKAHGEAILDVGPKLSQAWADQGRRLIDGDPDPLAESGDTPA